ncbi:MAG: aspartate kinase, partial [Marinobacter nauticus]|nr:aspartate kinase [Marinobacter nauticus]
MTTAQHTVEKIGGTSMSNYEAVRDNIIIGKRKKSDLYQRIFVVSAYGGVTNELLEHKKTGEPGVYALFADAESDWAWGDDLTKLIQLLTDINGELFADPMLKQQADQFITDRIEGVRGCLIDLQRLCSYGQFQLEEHLLTVREMLAGIGEAHSAFNTALKLQQEGINARFVDLTGWRDSELLPLDEKLKQAFDAIDLSRELPIVTGYAQCKEGLMRTFDRGYSEMTFSRTAVITNAREAIIHKEYHLSSADPNIVGEDKVVPLGRTNYDVADQLANLGMEAIHPRAGKGLRQNEIPLRVMNTFEPEHTGTLITGDYISEKPQVE